MKRTGLFLGVALLSVTVTSCSFGSSQRAFGPYSEAETFYRQADYSKAIGKYQEYLAANPQGNLAASAEYYIAKSYAASGDRGKALESFVRVTENFPKTSWAAFAKEQLETLSAAPKA